MTVDCLYLPVGIYKYFIYLYCDNTMNLVHKYEKSPRSSGRVLWSDNRPKRSLIELPHRWTRVEEIRDEIYTADIFST